MAKFEPAFDKTMKNEGGYKLHRNEGETADTYAGIYRKFHGEWEGWKYLDRQETPPTQLVRDFYKKEFWDKMQGDLLVDQKSAENIYDFYVNAGNNGLKVAQKVAGVADDGVIGSKSVSAINNMGNEFVYPFVLARCAYYGELISRRNKLAVFAKGWINRAIRGIQ